VSLVWLCEEGRLKKDYVAFDKFGVWSGELFLGEMCGLTLEKNE